MVGVLFPHAWCCYVDMRFVGKNKVEFEDVLNYLQSMRSEDAAGSNDPVADAHDARVPIVVFLDELEEVYTKGTSWREVSLFASQSGVACFAASSSGRFPLVVAGTDTVAIQELYGLSPSERPPPLNHTKLELRPLSPLTTDAQYRRFISSRYPDFDTMKPGAQNELVARLHMETGGNFRMLGTVVGRLAAGLPDQSDFFKQSAVPDVSGLHGLEAELLHALALSKPRRRGRLPPYVTKYEALAIMQRTEKGLTAAEYRRHLDHFVSRSHLQEIVVGDGCHAVIAARFPGVLARLQRVFLSHVCSDCGDATAHIASKCRKAFILAHYCERADRAVASRDQLQSDCDRERTWVDECSAAMLVMTDKFVERVMQEPDLLCDANFGCIRELDLIMQKLMSIDTKWVGLWLCVLGVCVWYTHTHGVTYM